MVNEPAPNGGEGQLPPAPPASPVVCADPPRILLVEGHVDGLVEGPSLSRQIVRLHLPEEQFDLQGVRSLSEAMTALERLAPDVVIAVLPPERDLALSMVEALVRGAGPFPHPGSAGVRAADLLAAPSPAPGAPVFALVSGDADLVARALELGAHDALRLPFDPSELRARLRSVARMQRRLVALREQAQRDPLTGLWNRSFFDARLEEELGEALRHGREVSLVMCDIDGFKRLNDLHGHPFGDEVLATVGAILHQGRAEDVPCRYGGEEFAIILPSTARVGAVDFAERLRVQIAALRWPTRSAVRTTASLGVADLASIGRRGRPDALIASADAALYRAKRAGRNRVVGDDPAHAGDADSRRARQWNDALAEP